MRGALAMVPTASAFATCREVSEWTLGRGGQRRRPRRISDLFVSAEQPKSTACQKHPLQNEWRGRGSALCVIRSRSTASDSVIGASAALT